MIRSYVTIPVTVKAVQWDGYNYADIRKITRENCKLSGSVSEPHLNVVASSGEKSLRVGSWIVSREDGALEVYSNEEFQARFAGCDKDQVSNISTALMAIKDLATSCQVPINIHFSDHWIYVNVGFGTPNRTEMGFYPQDTYRLHAETDDIYKWIETTAESIRNRKA